MPSPPVCPREEEAAYASAAARDGSAAELGGGQPGEPPLGPAGQQHLPSRAIQSVSTGPRSRYIPMSRNPSIDTVHVCVSRCCNITGNQTILDCLSEWGTLYLRGQPILSLFHLWELRLFLYPNLLKWSPCQSQASLPPLPSLPETQTVRPFRLLPSLVSRGHFLCQSPHPARPTKHGTNTKHLLCASEVPTVCHFAFISASIALWHVMMGG